MRIHELFVARNLLYIFRKSKAAKTLPVKHLHSSQWHFNKWCNLVCDSSFIFFSFGTSSERIVRKSAETTMQPSNQPATLEWHENACNRYNRFPPVSTLRASSILYLQFHSLLWLLSFLFYSWWQNLYHNRTTVIAHLIIIIIMIAIVFIHVIWKSERDQDWVKDFPKVTTIMKRARAERNHFADEHE